MKIIFIGVVVELPITKHVDNTGAIFLSENKLVYQWMKHIDMRHHFIWDYIDDRIVKLKIFIQKKPCVTLYREPK